MWPGIDDIWSVKQGVIRTLLHRSPLSLPGSPGKKRTLKSVAASVAEDAPVMEPQVAAEDADLQKELEESIKSMYDVPRGPLPLVAIREPESGKYQPLLEVPGKGKVKATEEQVKVKARLDQTLVLKLKARWDQTLVLKMKARLDKTLMKILKVKLDQTLDLDVADVSPQPSTEQLDEGFTAIAYLKISALEIYSSAINLQKPIVTKPMQKPKSNQ
nr:hypothetical protein [Tanacetum cinerariifolium]